MRSISGRAPGTDPDYVPVVEVFDNLSHTEIYQAVRQLDPAALSNAGQLFLSTSTGLGDEVENAHGEIRAAIADGWRGAAAQQAVDAVREFEQAGRKIADVLTAVGVRLSQAGDAAESVRAAVAEPAAAQPDPSAALIDAEQAGANAAIVRQAENARLDAVRAMETIYAGAFVPTGSGVPAFPDVTSGPEGAEAPAAGLGLSASAPNPSATGVGATEDTVAAADVLVGADTAVEGDAAVDAITAARAQVDGTIAAATTYAPTGSGQATTAPAQVLTGGAAPSVAAPASVSGISAATTAPTGYLAATDRRARRDNTSTNRATTATGGAVRGGADTEGTGAGHSDADDGGHFSDNGRPNAGGSGASGAATQSAATGSPGPLTEAATSSATSGTETAQASAEGRQDAVGASGEAAAGMSAGAIGGMMGGAMVAADHTRPPGGPRPQPRQDEDEEDDDDDFLRYLDEEPTYLEPADEVNALIGKMEPTSPAVLGEWTGRE
ncbi:WXG100 family type VII secretion target [Nocardia asteroides]|uniref:WXG100 family type VII secretion target n=1 Tax=Nocardia asteroides TaxID=1824 RepID=UPI001E3D91D2|nr:WXG100 family type VII secretion target [Nocardia asteroides]UGT57471.1 WXG100 family type VII secretion target [Nocardia asteroides]